MTSSDCAGYQAEKPSLKNPNVATAIPFKLLGGTATCQSLHHVDSFESPDPVASPRLRKIKTR